MIAEILSTGDEIRTGAVVDSNAAHIAETLEAAGLHVTRHTCVGDDLPEIAELLRRIGGRCDAAVVTGGLGPTEDDLTAAAAARAAGVELALDPGALAEIEAMFARLGRPMSPTNRKQAMLPAGSRRLVNPRGTAPGFSLQIDRATLFFLPGVPREMRRMLRAEVLPRIDGLRGGDRERYAVRALRSFGLPESTAGERLEGCEGRFPGVRLGLRARFPEIHVRLYASGRDDAQVERRLAEAEAWVARRLGNHLFSSDGTSLEALVGRMLTDRGATLAVAESCTGGLLGSRITDAPGSSGYFRMAAVTYANPAKIDLLGVSPETIARHGAVHEETAREMAEGVRRLAGADYALSTSGIAGPGGGTEEKPVGTVCLGVATPRGAWARRLFYPFGDRRMKKRIFAAAALDLLRRELLRHPAEER